MYPEAVDYVQLSCTLFFGRLTFLEVVVWTHGRYPA